MDEVETREQKLLRVLYHLARVEIAQMPTSQAYNWLQIPDIYQCSDFFLGDDTGEARVVGSRAEVALVHPQNIQTYHQPIDLRHILSPLGYHQEAAAAWSVHECVLLDGDETFVAGVASREPVPGTQGGYRDTPQSRSVLQCQDGLPLAVSNNRVVRTTSPENVSPHTL